jgi:hypothetical protein
MSESYPKWMYSPTEDAVVVPDEAAKAALGSGWYETPADFPKAEPKKTVPVDCEPEPDAEPVVKPHKRK